MVSATSRPPSSAAAVARRELARDPLGHARVDGEHVPVERAVGRRGHLRRAARSRRRRTCRGSRRRCPRACVPSCSPVAAHRASSSSRLAQRRRDRLAVAVGVRYDDAWSRSRAPPASIDSCRARHHRVDLLGRGLAADRVGAHHVAADRAVADEEAGVHPRSCPRAGRGTRRRSPTSSRRPARARRAACPRPSPSSGAGSRRRRPAAARA